MPPRHTDDSISAFKKEARSIYESAVRRPQIDTDTATFIADSITKIRNSNGALLGQYTP